MFNKVPVTNCEDTAIHVLRVCGELGTKSDANFLDVDCDSLHGRCAGEKANGSLLSRKSYLNFIKVLQGTKDEIYVDAVHPGYRFLEGNASFARACEESEIKFVDSPSIRVLDWD